MRPLDRKLLRDLWRLRGQVFTIALVVASGAGGFIGSLSAHTSLVRLRDSYYETGRFAHLFVECKRAPQWIVERIRALPGVIDVDTSVGGGVLIDLPDVHVPLSGRVISLPTNPRAAMNRVFVQRGRWPEPNDSNGVLVSEAFAKARHLAPGDTLRVLMNGKFETLRIRGIALSPEFIFAASLGGFSDDTRFGILWLNRDRLEAAYDMKGAFNRGAVRIARGASTPQIIAAIDRVLAPYGTTGAYDRSAQPSHRTLTQEINEQRVFGTVLPAVFLAVAAFLLNVLLSRHILTERSQIASLKALGYSNASIGAHFFKFVLVIVVVGILMGIAIGVAFGRWMTNLYTGYFHFPTSEYWLTQWLPLTAAALALLSGLAAAAHAVHAVVRLPPAEAMHPPAPAAFHRTLLDRVGFGRLYSPELRMTVRELERRPLRALLTTLGVASSIAILVSGTWWGDAFDHLMELEFGRRERADIVVALTEPVGNFALHDFAHLPGVIKAEGARDIPVRLTNGRATVRASLIGLSPGSQIRAALDEVQQPMFLTPGSLALSALTAQKLHLRPGDLAWVEPLQGSEPPRFMPVTTLTGDLMGMMGYADRRTAAQLAGDGDTISSVRLRVDRRELPRLLDRLRTTPRVAAVGDKTLMLEQFRATSAHNLLAFTGILSVFAACIAVGVVYNSARITLAEHAWELATLRVLGFSRAEVSRMLLGQIGTQIVIAIPLGFLMGHALSALLAALIHGEEFRIPLVIFPKTYAYATLVMLGAGLVSALIVRRRIDTLDLVGVLKTRE